MVSLKKFPWFVLLIAIYSPVALLVENRNEVGFFAANRAVIVVFLGESLLLVLLWIFYKDWQKVGFVAALLTVLFFSYGHVYSLVEKAEIVDFVIGRHRYLLFVWIVLCAIVFYLANKLTRFSVFEDAMKSVSILLVVLAAIRLTVFQYMEWRVMSGPSTGELSRYALQADPLSDVPPDIYYIILDAYGRSDVLSDTFNIDNTLFLNSLRSMGFFVANCSQSNYAHTHLSLASSLNYSYLDDLGSEFVPGNRGWAGLASLIRNNATRQFFEKKNYQIVAFETGYAWTEWRDADLFVKYENTFFSKNLTSFEALFIHTTIFSVAIDFGLIPELQQNIRHYEMTLSNLEALENLAAENSPKFVFAHLVIPHHPFVFGSDGRYQKDPSLSPAFENYTDEEYYNGYRQQVLFINQRILEIVESILSNSKYPPVIIIQGDHGPSHAGQEARISILNAYYLPDGSNSQLSAGITPVNTFRVILDAYFDQKLPILADNSYFSKNSDPYAYTLVPNECKP